jgi:hypothetical protein
MLPARAADELNRGWFATPSLPVARRARTYARTGRQPHAREPLGRTKQELETRARTLSGAANAVWPAVRRPAYGEPEAGAVTERRG